MIAAMLQRIDAMQQKIDLLLAKQAERPEEVDNTNSADL